MKLKASNGAIYDSDGEILLSSIGWQGSVDTPIKRAGMAERFVRAVNNFDAMLEALAECADLLHNMTDGSICEENKLCQACAAITAAKGAPCNT